MADPAEHHPATPISIQAASAALFRGRTVLLVERHRGAARGLWSLPGGHIEPGETPEQAARREVIEETGLAPGVLRFFGIHEVRVTSDSGDGERHYEINVFCGPAPAGEPAAAGDARAARFFDLDALAALPLTAGALSLIRRAHTMTQGAR